MNTDKPQKPISRREALKRIGQAAAAIGVAAILPGEIAAANPRKFGIGYNSFGVISKPSSRPTPTPYSSYRSYVNYRDHYTSYYSYVNYRDRYTSYYSYVSYTSYRNSNYYSDYISYSSYSR